MKDTERQKIDEMLMKYKFLVSDEVRSLYIAGADKDDLIQEGMIGLMGAIQDYDEAKGVPFEPFARLCISRRVYKAIEAAGRKKHMPLNTYVSIYDSDVEGSSSAGIPLEHSISAGDSQTPETVVVSRECTKELLTTFISVLSPLEREVLYFLIQEKSYREISRIMNREPKSIDNTITRLRKKLRNMLDKE